MNEEKKMEEEKEIKEKEKETKKSKENKKKAKKKEENEQVANEEVQEEVKEDLKEEIKTDTEKEQEKESEKNKEESKEENKEENKPSESSKEDKKEVKKKKKPKFVTIKIMIIVAIISLIICAGTVCYTTMKKNSIEFKLIGEENITLEVGSEYTDEGFAATDNTKDISNKVKVDSNLDTSKIGNYQTSYNLKLVYLNINQTLYRNINVVDTTSPELKVDGKDTITAYLGDKFNYPKYSAIDNYDGDITKNVKVESNLDLNKIGRYEINYKVTDSSGNESTEKITVSVEKKKNPYVVVSIANQKLEYYEYDKLVLSSSVVTGINGKTPRGNFKVLNKARDIILKGADYESFVSYWIAFKGAAFGFHDASWRSSFGGNIYKYAGSHGCVNMPYSKVKQLYNMIDIGTPVYIK